MKTTLTCICLMFISTLTGQCQEAGSGNFINIDITISRGQLNDLLNSSGQKIDLKDPVLVVSGDTAKVKNIHSRGNNSLTFQRKSLSIDLKKAIRINAPGDSVKLKKFDLLNLVMDKNLWHNRWAFLNLAELNLFPMFNTYCALRINGQPQGIYLVVEKPHHTAIKNKSPFVIRRGLTNSIADEYAETESKDEIKKYRKQYLNLYSDIKQYKGEELYKRLESGLNLDHYFAWLAFNYLVMNGDYEDEVFFYIRPETGRYDVIPWDYDDLFRTAPHEGMEARNSVEGFRNKFLFSSEDALDRAIASDEYLYAKYLAAMRDALRVLTPDLLSKTAEQVKEELRAISQDKMLSEATRYVGKNPFHFSEAERDIGIALNFVMGRRNSLVSELEK